MVLFSTACLLCSSGTVHLAERNFLNGSRSGFIKLWLATIWRTTKWQSQSWKR